MTVAPGLVLMTCRKRAAGQQYSGPCLVKATCLTTNLGRLVVTTTIVILRKDRSKPPPGLHFFSEQFFVRPRRARVSMEAYYCTPHTATRSPTQASWKMVITGWKFEVAVVAGVLLRRLVATRTAGKSEAQASHVNAVLQVGRHPVSGAGSVVSRKAHSRGQMPTGVRRLRMGPAGSCGGCSPSLRENGQTKPQGC